MKKILTLAAISLLSATSMIAREPTIIPDFQPEIKVSGEMMSNQFNTIPTFPKDTVISNLIVSLTFPGTYATWAINSADYVKVYNKAGEEVTPPKFEIGRPSDAGWNVITFNFYGWDQCDPNTDFTVKAAEGIIGDRAWKNDEDVQHVNPAFDVSFNVWEVFGKPRPNNTTYDFIPEISAGERQEKRVHGKPQNQIIFTFTFPEDAYLLNDQINSNCQLIGYDEEVSVKDPNEKIDKWYSTDLIKFSVSKDNPKVVELLITDLDIDRDQEYKFVIGKGLIGNKTWMDEDQCEGKTMPETEFEFNPINMCYVGVSEIGMDSAEDSPVYNLQGIRVDATSLPAGIYVKNGKKFVIR